MSTPTQKQNLFEADRKQDGIRRLQLDTLILSNFKGVKQFFLPAAGEDVVILGDNATGKTSLADAFNFLLFGKDSAGRANFEIKALDESGEPIHGLEHEVSAELLLDGQTIELRKVYAEKFVKKRGNPQAEFTGHTTEHYIDGVPVKQLEYTLAIAEICDESIFRLLTDPVHFSDRLHWQERRNLLLEVCGDLSDQDVIASNKDLADLPDILDSRSIDDHRKVLQARRRDLNRDIERIPVRIDETSRSLPELPEPDAEPLGAQLQRLRTARQVQQEEASRITAGGEVAEKRKELSEIGARMLELETGGRRKVAGLREEALRRLEDAKRKVSAQRGRVREIDFEVKAGQARIEDLERRITAFREDWYRVDGEQLDYVDEAVCPACGRDLPEEEVAEARRRALEEHNGAKARRLTEIVESGRRLSAEREEIKQRLDKLAGDHRTAEQVLGRLEAEVERIERELASVPEYIDPGPEHAKLASRREELGREIAGLQESVEPAIEQVRTRLQAWDTEIARVERLLQRIEQRAQGERRIEELKAEERRLAEEFAETERQLYLCESFTRAKVGLLEERINSRFRLARFKLFRELVNGGLEECCETTYQGVPYGTNLNAGARVQVGLDIIRTLQEHYRFAPPVWVDQSESVTSLPEMDCQLIRLAVSAADKKLRVEAAMKIQEEIST